MLGFHFQYSRGSNCTVFHYNALKMTVVNFLLSLIYFPIKGRKNNPQFPPPVYV